MRKARHLVLDLLFVNILSYGLVFALSVYDFSASRVIPAMALRWELVDSLLAFLRWSPAIQFIALAISLGGAEGEADELLRRSVLPATLAACLLAAAGLAFSPFLNSRRESILATSALFNSSLSSLRSELEAGDLDRARAHLGDCQAVSREDPRVAELAERFAVAELKASRSRASLRPDETPPPDSTPTSAREYYAKALEYEATRDYLSAHWYASRSASLDPGFPEAQRLAARAWRELGKRGGSEEDAARAEIFGKKLEGYEYLEANDPVSAYRVFRELADRKVDDPDVVRYLAESRAALDRTAFFKDEMDRARKGGAFGELFLRVPSSKGAFRVLAAKSAYWHEEALYLDEAEYIESLGGSARVWMAAPYAKLSAGRLLLVCVDRERPSTVYRPRWSAKVDTSPVPVIELEITPDAVFRAAAARASPGSLTIAEAWKAARESQALGLDPRRVVDELLRRLSLPFGLFGASVVGSIAGIRFRRRDGKAGLSRFLVLPLAAASVAPLYLLIERIDPLISALASSIAPGLASLAVSAALRTLIVLLLALVFAGSPEGTRPHETAA